MNRIKIVLEEKGIRQTWLADKLGKSFNTVNGYVQNRQQPRLEVLNEIAEILDIDVKELNIEFKAHKITEIHLRSGNDINLVGNIGDEIYPIWQGDDYSHLEHLEFIPNLSDDDEDYTASGNLKDIRLGYYRKINTQ